MCWCTKLFLKGLHPKIVSPFLKDSHRIKTMYAHKTQTVIGRILNAVGEHLVSGRQCQVGDSTHRGRGVNVILCWVPCNE